MRAKLVATGRARDSGSAHKGVLEVASVSVLFSRPWMRLYPTSPSAVELQQKSPRVQ
jgi:hypothetical protein